MSAPRISLVLVASASIAAAQPAPAPTPDANKVDARALLQSGLRLLEVGDYLGALAVFKDAYRRFPSAKLLLNIGTTQRLLDRKADAANSYQRYLESTDADPSRRAEVSAALAELDATVGRLEITVAPADAEVRVTDAWIAGTAAELMRVEPGEWRVEVRRVGFRPDVRTGTVQRGETAQLEVTLEELPPERRVERPRARLGALATAHIAVAPKLGSAWLVGATFDVTPRLGVDAAVLLGPGLISDGMATIAPPAYGGYLGASFRLSTRSLRPRIGVGLPVFVSDGARVFVRAAGGVEYVVNRHISFVADVGAEVGVNPQSDIRTIAVVPAIGVTGRL